MPRRTSVLLALPVVLLTILSGCTTTGHDPIQTSSATSTAFPPSPSSSSSPSRTAIASPQASSGPETSAVPSKATNAADPGRPSDQCPDAVIRVSISMPKGAAGSFEQDLLFTNTGSSSCVLRGAPGLSVVGDDDGTQIGAAAVRDQSEARNVRLAARGGQAYALFGGPELGAGSEGAKHCAGVVRAADGYRVYPPHSTRAFFIRDSHAVACPNGRPFLSVKVVIPEGTDY